MTKSASVSIEASAWLKAALLGAALMAFCLQPLVRFADAGEFMSGGALIAASLTGFAIFTVREEDKYAIVWGTTAALMGLQGVWILTAAVFAANNAAAQNDVRCLAIQRDMLSAHRRIADGPDLFQALGCRPQGGGIIRVRPTDRELKARRPLPDGGYLER